MALIPHLSTEIEWYFIGGDAAQDADRLVLILAKCAETQIPIASMDEETGPRQYEISLAFTPHISQLITHTTQLKAHIESVAQHTQSIASFTAKPYADQPGSGLHIHVSMHDAEGRNLFQKKRGEPDTDHLIHAVGGLCHYMLRDFIYFAPHEESYARFLVDAQQSAPVNISWGSNNRTTAIRIPTSTLHPDSRHIEHRVSGADADAALVIPAIIEAAQDGIAQQRIPPEKCYGNAFDAQYEHTRFPTSLAEAHRCHLLYR